MVSSTSDAAFDALRVVLNVCSYDALCAEVHDLGALAVAIELLPERTSVEDGDVVERDRDGEEREQQLELQPAEVDALPRLGRQRQREDERAAEADADGGPLERGERLLEVEVREERE